MHKYLFICSVILIAICFACGDQSLDEISTPMGEEYIDNSAGIVMIDTFSISMSTAILDSVGTSQTGTALVGSFSHPQLGNVHSDAIFRMTTPGKQVLDEDDIYDSIEFCIKYDGYYLGDTISEHSFTVNEVASDLIDMKKDQEVNNVKYNFYNTTRVLAKRELGSFSTSFSKVSDTDTIKIPLDKEFGRDLFEMFKRRTDTIEQSSLFLDFFRGIVLKSNRETNNTIIGYDASESICMKIFYHRTMDQRVDKEIVFKAESSAYQFNSIETEDASDGSGIYTLLDNENIDIDINSKDLNDICYVQGGTGILTKFEFPGLKRAEMLPALNQIIKAELILVPTANVEDDFNTLLSNLAVYESDTKNARKDQLTTSSGDVVYMQLNDNFLDEEENPYYSIDITRQFVTELLDGVYDDDFSFLVGLPGTLEGSTVTTLSFGGHNNQDKDFEPKLRLYTYYYKDSYDD